MNFIQTFWSCNKKTLLYDGFGFLSAEYNLMSWTLSCLQLKKYYSNLTLYTDSVAAKILIDELGLPYKEVICNLDNLNQYHPHLWALPKIYSYSHQEKPFLHIDGDVFIWKSFDKEILKSELIAQNAESDTNFYQSILENVKANFLYVPRAIINEVQIPRPVRAYNAGVLGGSDIVFFKEYCKQAFEFVDKNKGRLHKINISNFNNIFEQLLFYCLAVERNKKVGVFISEEIKDLRYVGFANFLEIPYNKQYLHLHGEFKRNKIVCNQLVNRLRMDYPENYYRIINLFRKNKIELQNYTYCQTKVKSISGFLHRFHSLKQGNRIRTPIFFDYSKSFDSSRSKCCNHFFSSRKGKNFPKEVIEKLKADLYFLEKNIKKILESSFSKIDANELYRRDILNASYPQIVFRDKNSVGERKIVCAKHFKIIPTRYDWSFLDESKLLLEEKLEKVINSGHLKNHSVIVPECFGDGYSLSNADELDQLLFRKLDRPKSINELFDDIVNAFDPKELKDGFEKLELLVYGRIKIGFLYKTITCLIEN